MENINKKENDRAFAKKTQLVKFIFPAEKKGTLLQKKSPVGS
jgi:hypothetical protein